MFFPVLWSVFCLIATTTNVATEHYFTAAVYEHVRVGDGSTDAPYDVINKNLEFYKKAATVAKSKGADIIVYPEYGLFSPKDRNELKNFLEYVPDPKRVRTVPCDEEGLYFNRSILYSLSCISKTNEIVVVANIGDIQPCSGKPGCPEDGSLHLNTNIAFDKHGALVGRYHKEHLFFEFGMDLPLEAQDPVFSTDLGTFGMFVCFDSVFKKITDVSRLPGVDAVLLTTMWIDPTPLMTSIQLWQSWALGNNATFLVANIQMPGYLAVGSGLFNSESGALAYTYNPDGISKLVIAKVPKRYGMSLQQNSTIIAITSNGSSEFTGDGKDVPTQCSKKVLGPPENVFKDYRCMEENISNYTLTKLIKTKDHLEACNNGMCCSLDYSMNNTLEDFYFGVYNGTYNMYDRYFWCIENCLLVRCDPHRGRPCVTFPMRTKNLFYRVSIKANFSTELVYPSIMKTGMRLLPLDDWNHRLPTKADSRASIEFESLEGKSLIVAGLNGRCYDRDPPYQR